jgi:hypothetical protein
VVRARTHFFAVPRHSFSKISRLLFFVLYLWLLAFSILTTPHLHGILIFLKLVLNTYQNGPRAWIISVIRFTTPTWRNATWTIEHRDKELHKHFTYCSFSSPSSTLSFPSAFSYPRSSSHRTLSPTSTHIPLPFLLLFLIIFFPTVLPH